MSGVSIESRGGGESGHRLLRFPLLMMVVTAALLLIAAAGSLVFENRRHTLNEAGRENLNVARLVGFHTLYVLNTSVLLLDSIADNVRSRGFSHFQSEEGKRFLLNRTQDYPDLQSMLLIDKNGKLLVGATLPFPPPNVNYRDREYFQAHLGGQDLVFGEQLMSRTQGRRGVTMSRTIRSVNGEFEGIVLVTIEGAHFERMFQSVRGLGDEDITIFREDGAIFARYPDAPVGQRYPTASVLSRAQAARSGIYEALSVFDERLRIIAFERIGDFPLIVVSSQVRQEVLASWWNFCIIVSIALLFAFVWLGAAGRYAFRSVVQNETLQLELSRLARTDSLTDLANRRHFSELAEKELSRALRFEGTLSLLMVDVDHFKRINDTHGHSAGDEVLRQLSELFRLELRNIDIVGRLGGEEFAIVLAQSGRAQAEEVAERLRKTIEDQGALLSCGVLLHYTVSIGVATLTGSEDSIERLLKRADDALYAAKSAGRNNVKVAASAGVLSVTGAGLAPVA